MQCCWLGTIELITIHSTAGHQKTYSFVIVSLDGHMEHSLAIFIIHMIEINFGFGGFFSQNGSQELRVVFFDGINYGNLRFNIYDTVKLNRVIKDNVCVYLWVLDDWGAPTSKESCPFHIDQWQVLIFRYFPFKWHLSRWLYLLWGISKSSCNTTATQPLLHTQAQNGVNTPTRHQSHSQCTQNSREITVSGRLQEISQSCLKCGHCWFSSGSFGNQKTSKVLLRPKMTFRLKEKGEVWWWSGHLLR